MPENGASGRCGRGAWGRAFTITELLVVIGIIALLIGILLPVLLAARRRAAEVTCSGNLRQIGMALALYTNQYDYYPGCQQFSGFGDPRTFAIWPTRLRGVLRGSSSDQEVMKIFRCPVNPTAGDWKKELGSGSGFATPADTGLGYDYNERLLQVDSIAFSYAYNDWGAGPNGAPDSGQTGLGGDIDYPLAANGYGREIKASRVRVPTEMIAVADSSSQGAFNYNIDPRETAQYPGAVHHGGANVLFCDGHVQWYLQADLINVDPSTPAGAEMNRMWNNDHQVHLRIE